MRLLIYKKNNICKDLRLEHGTYKMVTQMKLRTCKGKHVITEEKQICHCCRSKQMYLTDPIFDITPHVPKLPF